MNLKRTLTLSTIGASLAAVGAAYALRRRSRKQALLYGELSAQNEQSAALSSSPPTLSEEHAVSAVTGGLPEDMNEMPPTENFELEGPIYDGHDLSVPTRSEA